MTEKTLTITEVKKHLLELVDDIDTQQGRITITKNGIPTTMMMSIKDYESMVETLEILSEPGIMKILSKAKSTKNRILLNDSEVWEA